MTRKKRTLNKILAATSLAEASDPVLRAAFELARRSNAELIVFHAYQMPASYYGSATGMTMPHPEELDSQRQLLQIKAEEQMRRLGVDEGDWAEVVLTVGAPHRMLIETAERLEADLIVVGGAESKRPLTAMLGSTADRVLRKARCPVLVVKGELRLPLAHVLAPVDLSELAGDSLCRGLQVIAQLNDGRPLEVETLFVLSRVEREGSTQFTAEQIDRFAAEELDRFLERLEMPEPVRLKAQVRSGLPRHEIIARLREQPTELVVIGTHGRSGFERLLLGSIAAEVANRAPCNVLVAPPPAAKQTEPETADAAAAQA